LILWAEKEELKGTREQENKRKSKLWAFLAETVVKD